MVPTTGQTSSLWAIVERWSDVQRDLVVVLFNSRVRNWNGNKEEVERDAALSNVGRCIVTVTKSMTTQKPPR